MENATHVRSMQPAAEEIIVRRGIDANHGRGDQELEDADEEVQESGQLAGMERKTRNASRCPEAADEEHGMA